MTPARERTPEERAFSLHSAAQYHVGSMLFGGTSSAAVIDRIRATVSGFSEAEYRAALDQAKPVIVSNRASALRYREQLVGRALQLDLLNALFCLRLYNRRHGHQNEHLELYEIDIAASLIPPHTRDAIDRALPAVDAAINAGAKFEHRSSADNLRAMRDAHPGFTDDNLQGALSWGAFINR